MTKVRDAVQTVARGLVMGALALASSAGCGDGPICPSEVVVVISSPAQGSTISADTSADPGVQTTVQVRTNLSAGDTVELVITDASDNATTETATVDENGDANFTNITVPAGVITLAATGTSKDCGAGTDEVAVTVFAGDEDCVMTLREGPLDNTYYAPLKVLNSSNDSDADLPNFQANLDVASIPGFNVEIFVLDLATAQEASAGTMVAGDDGAASFPVNLLQGGQQIRARCRSMDGNATADSAALAVFVDTEAPTCRFTNPVSGSTIIPSMDEDSGAADTQLTLRARVDHGGSGDVEGEATTFTVDNMDLPGGAITVMGEASVNNVTFATIGDHALAFASQDHAGNGCSTSQTNEYVTNGCSVTFQAPVGTITTDGNASTTDGIQADLVIQVGAACEGQLLTTDCGVGNYSETVPVGGLVTIPITACATYECELTETCTASVTSGAGITVNPGHSFSVDTLAPPVTLQFVDPVTACGMSISASDDVDAMAPGIQIDVRIFSPLASLREVKVTNDGGTTTTTATAGGDARITVAIGANNIVAAVEDTFGNRRETSACQVTVADLLLTFTGSPADGLVGRNDGTVMGNNLTFNLCGTVSVSGATVTVDAGGGMGPQPASVTGTTWCRNGVTLAGSATPYSVTATATAGMSNGSANLSLVVDLTPPPSVTALNTVGDTRQSVTASFTAPSDGGSAVAGYLIKYGTTAFTEGNFDTTGTAFPAPTPGTPGAAESVRIEPLRTGTGYHLAVAAVDAAGNRSSIQTAGPIIPLFDQTGAITAPTPGDGAVGLGQAITRGKFNADDYWDVAVAAPSRNVGANSLAGTVYVYFGGPNGIQSTPSIAIEGTQDGGQFGNGVTAVRWSNATYDDLVAGAPFEGSVNGNVYVFNHAVLNAAASTITSAAASTRISAGGGWFTGAACGWSLATARFDSDALDDLVIGCPGGAGFNGGLAVLYGGTATGSPVLLDDTSAAGMQNARVRLIRDPGTGGAANLFGLAVFNLGRTEGVSDPTEDIGSGYFEDDDVYVFRGAAAKPATAGVQYRDYAAATDLRLQDNSTDGDGFRAFGASMGSLPDQNGDGARDLVISAWREGAEAGRVFIIDGNAVGTQSVSGALTTITGAAGVTRVGAAILNNARGMNPDIDNDGQEDLAFLGSLPSQNRFALYIWFGGNIPTGAVTTATASHTISAPTSFNVSVPTNNDVPAKIAWAGDVNDDGLDDICWGDYNGNTGDGSFEVLWDDGI